MSRIHDGLLAATLLLSPLLVQAQSVPVVSGTPAVETFDSLVSTGTSSTLPSGWFLAETGSNANTTYAADDGALNSGNTYSYGNSASADRALGGLQSSSLNPVIGARLVNQTSGTLNEISVQYTGEQWRLGATGRVDRMDFQYSLDATSLTTGTWVDVDALDLIAPVTTGTAGSALNGNLAANRISIAGNITGLTLAAGATVWVRWTDFNPSGSDDALAIEDISFGTPGNVAPSVTSTVPAHNGSVLPGTQSFTVNFSESVTAQDTAFTMQCSVSGSVPLSLPAPKGRAQPTVRSGPLRLAAAGGVSIMAAITGSSVTLTTTANLQDGETCTLTIDADGIVDSENAHPTADTVVNFSVVQPPNELPSVVSTVPANNGSVLPGTQSFTVNFSESVTAQDTAFSMTCSITGNVVLTLPAPKQLTQGSGRNGGPPPVRLATLHGVPVKAAITGSSVALSTTALLQDGETCVFSIDADGIADAQGAHPTADTVVNFSVAPPPNVLPTVASSTPANNATGVAAAADFRIVFSEMVSADSESFVLQCSQTGTIAPLFQYKVLEVTETGGLVITLSPRVLLQPGETCTLTVLAVGVVDDDDAAMAQDHLIHFTVAASVSGYYAQVNTSSAEQLRCSLHEIINGHTAFPYSASTTDTWDILNIADEDPGDATRILDVYRNARYTKISGGTGEYNREHTWPNTYGFSDGNPGPYTDTHMLYLTHVQYNSDRGSKPFADCNSGCTELPTLNNYGVGGAGGGDSNYVISGSGENNGSFEVWDHRKGDMARAVMYMAIRYEGTSGEPDLELTDTRSLITSAGSGGKHYMGLLSTLVAWHQADPPTAAEVERNEVVQSFQGNRNPFIDHPEWATQALFTSSKPASCQMGN